ncbi:MAG: hypothetical protein ACREFI_13120, partial [Stellaceae bacterium]
MRRIGLLAAAFGATAIAASACSSGGGGGSNGPGAQALASMTPGAFATSSDALVFAQSASAGQVLNLGVAPALVAGSEFDPACPHVQTNGSMETITGGCTDDSGNTYDGTIK